MWRIKKELLEDLCYAAKQISPNEFLCLLGGDAVKKEITHFIFIPSSSDNKSASIFDKDIVFEKNLVGTIHSHPKAENIPSKEDKKMFKMFKINAIIGGSFTPEETAFYDSSGNNENVILE